MSSTFRAATRETRGMPRLGDLEALSFRFFGIPAGTWWVLFEADTHWSDVRDRHPWILVYEFSQRTVFAHAVPRSSRHSDAGLEHPPHVPGHDGESMCFLERKGWVLPTAMRQIEPIWFDHGWRSCQEASESDLLAWFRAHLGSGPA